MLMSVPNQITLISSIPFKVCTYGPQIKQKNKQTKKTHTVWFLGNYATEDIYGSYKLQWTDEATMKTNSLKVWAKTSEQEESKWFSLYGFSAVYIWHNKPCCQFPY